MTTLLAKNATVLVTMDDERRELRDAGLFARDGIIVAVGPADTLPETADEVIDLSGQIVLPGLVNCHHHLDQVLTRNLPAAQDTNLFPWLKAHYRIWASRTPEASRTATIVGAAELALSGCTTLFDHAYVFQNGCRVDDQIAAAREIGIRFVVSRGSMSLGESRGGLPPDSCVEDEDAILADCERVVARYHETGPGAMTQIVLAPCSPFSVTPELMRESAGMARRLGVRLHTHLCETIDEERFTLERFGMRPVDYLETLDWAGGDVWYAHAIHVNDDEIRRFAHRGTGVCHCPSSNMRLASGIAPVRQYLDAGVKVGLGVDGSASNDANHMLNEARMAMLLARLRLGLPPPAGPDNPLPTSHPDRAHEWMKAREILEVATRGGAAVLGRDDIGALQPGKCADFFTLDLNAVTFAGGLSDPVAATLFCMPGNARHTFVGGRAIVRDGRVVTVDLPAVVAEHNRHAARMAASGG
ncbi:Cytosine/adenosine deaminase [Pseudoxanthobacter soli DSM 19599]|uniref:Cytosine/adenosine deaminase n=1 Tax=Pseudoxanthobacter soli DSM 19599 TaxID=1123029 RepID=A0A1M7ZRE2_9HYPH|nr:8-oxoguanine deaminase [Pseudoxanthobacter soli]SHO67441.1 Cytosine/adenosine deaminase [Pseudoxanthobacter soli DSM 19599]